MSDIALRINVQNDTTLKKVCGALDRLGFKTYRSWLTTGDSVLVGVNSKAYMVMIDDLWHIYMYNDILVYEINIG